MLWDLGINYAQGNFIQEPCQQMNYDFFGEIVSEEDDQGRAVYTIN
jgi:EAL domain-containing protein (putative c-di-GMP-specific phosphodiesterase class I)